MKIKSFTAHLDPFLAELKYNGLSKHTCNAYRRDLTELFKFINLFQQENPQLEINPDHFTWAMKRLSFQNRHPSTISRKVSAWRKYCHYFENKGLLKENLLCKVKAPKIPARLPKAIEASALNDLFSHHGKDNRDPFLICREEAMFELMYGSGLRVSEVEALNIHDLELEEGWVTVKGKGSKTRQIPLTTTSMEAIKKYLRLRPDVPNQNALFVSMLGRRISNRRIQQNLNEWAIRHDFHQPISPHMLRHSFATQILQNSQNIRAVQELLGHKQLSTTQIYTKLDFDHLAEVYDKAHPRAKKKNK